MNIIEQADLYKQSNQLIIDVRSPMEYDDYHIHLGINYPLFSNEEREQIGKTYKQVSDLEAKKLGVQYMAKNLNDWMTQVIEWNEKYDRVIFYCQRGGMRSRSLVALFNSLGFDNIYQLRGGIKGHRQYMSDSLPSLLKDRKIVVLHGHTGVGKTKILQELTKHGIATLDLEKFAENAGSVFGNILYPKPAPSQKQFEELVYYHLLTAPTSYVFTESESKRIGKVFLPDWLMDHMKLGDHILIEASIQVRTDNLVVDYKTDRNDEALIDCLNHLRKRLSNETTDELIQDLKDDRVDLFVEKLLVQYYDPLYQYTIDKYDFDYKIEFKNTQQATHDVMVVYRKEIQ